MEVGKCQQSFSRPSSRACCRNNRVSIRADAGLPSIRLQLRLQRIYPGLSAHCNFWIGVAPGVYYAPGYYNYAPAYVAPGYNGWNEAGWNHW